VTEAASIEDDGAPHVCASTGLALVPSTGGTIWRLAKSSYGPLNPEKRKSGGNSEEWGRYDVRQHRTVYGAQPIEASYAESLAFARKRMTLDQPQLRELFDDVDPADTTALLEAVQREWAERHHMLPGQLNAGWRYERLIHEIYLPADGWFVDIEASDSVAAASDAVGGALAALGVKNLTVGHLRGEDRRVTTAVAEWVWPLVLDDGSLPLGIRFGSKHGSDWTCWAVWLRAVDDDKPSAERTTASPGTPVEDPEHNPPLQHICNMFHIKFH
jgi:hypothetical protein